MLIEWSCVEIFIVKSILGSDLILRKPAIQVFSTFLGDAPDETVKAVLSRVYKVRCCLYSLSLIKKNCMYNETIIFFCKLWELSPPPISTLLVNRFENYARQGLALIMARLSQRL